jgi:hypothetical protein
MEELQMKKQLEDAWYMLYLSYYSEQATTEKAEAMAAIEKVLVPLYSTAERFTAVAMCQAWEHAMDELDLYQYAVETFGDVEYLKHYVDAVLSTDLEEYIMQNRTAYHILNNANN